mgnify:CR=1 FL=1
MLDAFALTGRHSNTVLPPGCYPGLGASALSGRIGHSNRTGRNISEIRKNSIKIYYQKKQYQDI